MARKKPSIIGAIRARQREGRERRRHVDKFPTKLPGAERVLELVESGELRWYALLIVPQKEAAAQEMLARKGITSYCPMDFKWRKANKFAVDQTLFSFPLMPGWLFIGMPHEAQPWHDVVSLAMVRAVVAHDGWPVQIPQSAMLRMVTRFRNGVVRADEVEDLRPKRRLQAGDTVKMLEGPMRSFTAKVVEMNGGVARVMFSLFGMSKPVDVSSEAVEYVAPEPKELEPAA